VTLKFLPEDLATDP